MFIFNIIIFNVIIKSLNIYIHYCIQIRKCNIIYIKCFFFITKFQYSIIRTFYTFFVNSPIKFIGKLI